MRRSPLEPWLLKLASVQLRHPAWIVALVLLSVIPAALFASNLTLRTAFSELLPEDKPSVIELERVKKRLPSISTLTVAVEGGDVASLQRFVDALSERIAKLDKRYVSHVETGTREIERFVEQNKHLYAPLEDIRELHAEVLDRYDQEVSKKAGFDLGLDDDLDLDAQDEPPVFSREALEQRFAAKIAEARKVTQTVDGYYLDPEEELAAILVRTPLSSGDPEAFELRRRIERIVKELDPKSFHPRMQVGFTGNLITSAEQHRAVTSDLAHVGMLGVGLILAVVFLFFLRFRTLFAMTLTIAVGCIWSFGTAYFTVGYLNSATGFLVSIIAGNGINFSIIYMARYIEARREDGLSVEEAIKLAHRETHVATLSAGTAAGIAYGSLAATDFHGFKHFGIIGGIGMLECWVATYMLLPAILVLSERVSPMFSGTANWRQRLRGIYGYPFAALVTRLPRTAATLGLALTATTAVLSVLYFTQDPMEYNLHRIKNEPGEKTSAQRLSVRVDKLVGRLGQDGRAILTDRLDQVQPLANELERRRASAPEDNKPFSRVVTIYDLLPKNQEQKIPLLHEMRDRLERAHRHGSISDEDFEELSQHLPASLEPIDIANLPAQLARPFTEKDGRRGLIVYIVPTQGKSVYSARYLMHWADAFREVELPDGDIIRGTGDPVIFSDMLINIEEDAPKAILLSLLGTLIVVVVAFRGKPYGWLALATVLGGVTWLIALLYAGDIKLNFLNFVALPITIGVGADYAINMLKRVESEGTDRLRRTLIETGGAVALCSLTTTLGYTALLSSINRAVQSFGLAAAVGEVTTLLAALVVTPAVLAWRRQRSNQPAPSP